MELEGKLECTDLVVFVPGLMGSVLERAGKPLWNPGLRMGLRALLSRGDFISALHLQDDSPTVDDVDGVVATRVLDVVHLIPGLWKIDSYAPVWAYLKNRLTLTPGKNYYEFPYDWRRDIRYCARSLGREVESRLRAWREQSGKADAQAVLITHSMGGLVARYFLECLGGWLNTRALITLGTPHRGALSALKALVNGMEPGVGPLRFDFTSFVASCTSSYQLLPVWECLDTGNGKLQRPGEVEGVPGLSSTRAAAGLAFHREIQTAVASNRRDPRWDEHGYELHPIVGTRQRTSVAARLEQGQLVMADSIRGRQIDGDATVSRVSATPIELSRAGREVFVAAKHSVMHKAPEVLHHIEGVLTNASLDLALFFSDGEVELGLELGDLYAAGQPIEARVEASDSPGALEVVVTPAAGGDVCHRAQIDESDLGEPIVVPGLAAGTYRMHIQGGEGVRPIEDIFEVFDSAGVEQHV